MHAVCNLFEYQSTNSTIFRYSFGGEPLTMIHNELATYKVPACSHCGRKRVFELQLMPNLIYCMKKVGGENESGDSEETRAPLARVFDFGTVSIYSCPMSCMSTSNEWYHEAVHVQPSI